MKAPTNAKVGAGVVAAALLVWLASSTSPTPAPTTTAARSTPRPATAAAMPLVQRPADSELTTLNRIIHAHRDDEQGRDARWRRAQLLLKTGGAHDQARADLMALLSHKDVSPLKDQVVAALTQLDRDRRRAPTPK